MTCAAVEEGCQLLVRHSRIRQRPYCHSSGRVEKVGGQGSFETRESQAVQTT